MKRTVILIAMIVFAYSLQGQGNSFRYPVTIGMGAPGTVTGGSLILRGLTSGTATIRVPAVAGTGTIFQLPANNGTNNYVLTTNGSGVTSWSAAPATGITAEDTLDMLAPYPTLLETRDEIADSLNAFRANTEEGSTFYALHSPDTVQHTSNYTVGASDWPKDQHCLKATSIVITLPTNLTEWPVGGIMNFYGEGAGIMVFKGGIKISDSDSIATSRKGQVVSVKKLAASKYFLIGPLTD